MDYPAVGYVVREFPRASETFVANEILELERQGLPVRIYSYRRPKADVPHEGYRLIQSPVTYLPDPLNRHPWPLFRSNADVYGLDPVRYRRTALYVLAHTLRERNLDTWRRFLQAVWLTRLVNDSDVRHLHAHFARGATRIAMLASMLTGLSFSFTAHARDIYSNDVDRKLLREKMERARFVVTVCHYNREFLADRIGVARNGHLRVLYNGVDLKKFSPDPSVVREDGLVLGVGRLVEKKGFSCLIRAAGLLRDWDRQFRCEIVGDGGQRSHLEREIRQNGLEQAVSLAGARSQEELTHYYRRAAVLAMPAVLAQDGNRDALPTVLLEGMACGLPAVASRLTGIPEIVDHEENGLLVEPGDAAELARALDRMLGDPGLRERLGMSARAKAERSFDLGKNVRELHAAFAESLDVREPVTV